jgi:pimeloyl-ACP methyl ester carboxylesterase
VTLPSLAGLGAVQLAYDDVGNPGAATLLLVHGFPHTRALWRHQVQALAPSVRCLVPDLRNFGASAGPAARTVDDHADDLVRLLDHRGIDRAIVGGLSMGGYIALALWRRHADRVRGLVLCDTRMGPDGDEARARRGTMIAVAERSGSAAVAELLLTGMVGETTRRERPDVADTLRAMMAAQPPSAIIDALHALRDRPDSTDTLPTVTVPTLVLCGAEDTLTPPAESEAMHAALGRAPWRRLEIIPGAGHAACLERPAAVTWAIAECVAAIAADS